MSFSPLNVPIVESERLLLRGWREDDLDMIDDIFSNEKTAEFIGGVMPRWRSWRYLATCIGHWQIRGYGTWVLEEKSSGRSAGFSGLWFPDGWPEREISYSLCEWAHGNGYAVEAAKASLRFAYETLGWTTTISMIDERNLPSQKVAERMGASFEKPGTLFGDLPAQVWRHLPPAEFRERFA